MSLAQDSNDNSAVPRFPHGALALALLAMILIATVGIAVNWFVGERVKTITESQVAVLSATQDVAHFAREKERIMDMAVATGDVSYLEERIAVQARLQEGLAALEQAILLPENRATFRHAFAAEGRLRTEEERQALMLASGQVELARRLSQSRETAELRMAFLTQIAAIERRSQNFVDASNEEVGFWLDANLLGNLLAITLIGTTIAVIVRRMRSWGRLLRRMELEARKGEQAKAAFLATMSHEIRTPLNGVIGFAEMLQSDPTLGAEQRRQVRLIQSAGSMLLTVVNDVLDFSRLEADRVELNNEPFSLAALLDQCVSIIRPMAADKKLSMSLEVDAGLAPWHMGDCDRLRQVVLNLLNNAVKFTQSGHVIVTARRAGEATNAQSVVIEVTDTGIGIPEDRIGQLFEPFTQADSRIAKHFGGSGLGLSICRRLVTLMGGEIALESAEGKGSTFSVWLDLPLASPPVSRGEEGNEARRGARILLVEDLPMNREIACAMLSRGRHAVQCADCGEQALFKASSQDFDLILMDIQMPGMDGIETTRKIRALPGQRGDVPIVAMTANTMPHQIAAYQEAGMVRHVAKPLRQAELDATIAGILSYKPPVAESPDPDRHMAFDSAALDQIAAIMPHDRLAVHLAALQALVHAACEADRADDEVEAMAHMIGSQAAALGLVRVSAYAQALEVTLRDGKSAVAARRALTGSSNDVERFAIAYLQRRVAA